MTTASNAARVPFRDNRFLQALSSLFLVALAASASMWVDWWLENLLVFALIGLLAATYRRLALSELSYLLIFVFLCFHEWGATHKYADVPLGEWMKPFISTSRNHYDRVMHLLFGLTLAYPLREFFLRAAGARGVWAYVLPCEAALGLGAAYELMEAAVASMVSPQAGDAFVGMQGDMRDAQKDMALGLAGAIVTMALTAAIRSSRRS